MKEKYYWSAVIAAFIALILVMIFTLLVFSTEYRPLPMVYVAGGFAVYALIGAFVQGRDR